ncbi:MAG: helix-turn-helix domain-containing protein [Pseudomonadota bacterium]
MRLITLLTARYDWRRDELAVGQREIARLWSVTERTVNREISDLRTRGWLILKRPAAQGRVSVYRLSVEATPTDTEDSRTLVGDDFVDRAGRFSGRSSTITGAGGHRDHVVRVAFSSKMQPA